VFYYRVRFEQGGNSSDYSNGIVVRVGQPIDWVLDPVDQYDDRDLLDVQRALIRMSAARGDLLALLSVPQHYREVEALAHVAKLVPAQPGTSDAAAFSYGALYHPWLTGREENQLDVLRTSPPEGAIAGTLATRSLSRGAWIAPANEPLHGVVAFSAQVSRDYWQALQDAQVNVIRQEPAGFLCMDSDTLSTDPEVQPINVRRLMMLLRKTALRLGSRYVFEPSNDAFRRSVQRGFESMLETMFFRGAFSGRTPSTAFQVVTDETLNTPQSMERGRFIVDLKVAPSVPLTFLTVRLLQTADRTSVTEGVGA
jgi:phage tail sheath protein FI